MKARLPQGFFEAPACSSPSNMRMRRRSENASRTRLQLFNAPRAFNATARHFTVFRTADELSVTPSAVSHQLRIQEDALGVQLFTRTRSDSCTPHCGALVPSIRALFQMIASAAARLGDAVMVGYRVSSAERAA